ncbi:MAG: metallophosphoesterase family protein [Saccharofermentanales bacterium]
MIYITGDTHGDFSRFTNFCQRFETTKNDIMIILGDAGINYFGGSKDKVTKENLQAMPLTFFCIHGNHEIRPATLPSYENLIWNNGIVYYEPEYNDLLFAKDGEVCNLIGYNCLVLGGAYSVDKYYRLRNGYGWWEDEQPSDEIKSDVEQRLQEIDEINVVLSHTCPYKYIPREVFLSFIDQSTVDNTTEEWLDTIEERLNYQKWYCGHYHTEKKIDNLQFLYKSVDEFYSQN